MAHAQSLSPAATISGVVVNKITESPVKNAHVIYTRIDHEAAGTSTPLSKDADPEGRFSLPLQPGTYRLWVERSGFARQVYGALSPAGEGTTITLAYGQQLGPITFRMVPLGAIAGRVLDEDGDPVQSAGIQVLRFSYANGHRQLISVAGAASNDRGEYRVFGLRAGRYLLQASLPGAPMSRPFEAHALVPEAQDAYAASYYPGVVDVDAASPISLNEGAELSDIDFRLHKVHAVSVRGRLSSPVEKFAASQLQVVLAHNEGGSASYIDRASAFVDPATGRFEVRGVSPGSYLLVAAQLFSGHPLAGRIPLEVSATSREEVALPLAPPFDIFGVVELEGAPRGSLPNLIVRLAPAEGLALGPQPASKVASDGSIHLAGVTPGKWMVVFESLPEGLWVKHQSFAGNEIPAGELNLTEIPRGQLHVVLAGNSAQVSGTVTSGGQPCRSTVVLVPAAPEQRGTHQMYRATNATERGLFTLKGVPPGSYKLFAFQEIEPFEWFDPEKLKNAEEMGLPVTVSAGEN
ncbi:MAG TPA: carboxypeptidase regulatory-like domain-containing protein, partial [Candidatus Angelobacter sp.]|nr:carboxypeptidase regulatory-like domain-containing protein [Candidatus Angelobacter sp.]